MFFQCVLSIFHQKGCLGWYESMVLNTQGQTHQTNSFFVSKWLPKLSKRPPIYLKDGFFQCVLGIFLQNGCLGWYESMVLIIQVQIYQANNFFDSKWLPKSSKCPPNYLKDGGIFCTFRVFSSNTVMVGRKICVISSIQYCFVARSFLNIQNAQKSQRFCSKWLRLN